MKTRLRKPARDRASYTDQYKQEALELWRAGWTQCSYGKTVSWSFTTKHTSLFASDGYGYLGTANCREGEQKTEADDLYFYRFLED